MQPAVSLSCISWDLLVQGCLNCEPLCGICSCLDWIPLKEEDDELLLGKMVFWRPQHCVCFSLSLHKYCCSSSEDLKSCNVSSWEVEQENTSEKLLGTSILSLCLGSRSNVTLVHYYYFFHTSGRKTMNNLTSFFLCVPWLKEGTHLICNLCRGTSAILTDKRNVIPSEVGAQLHNTITGAT